MTPKNEGNDSLDSRVSILERDVNRVLGILDGRAGEKGLKQEFTDFFSAYNRREIDKQIYDDRSERKQNKILTALLVVGTLMLALIAMLTYEHEVHHSLLQPRGDLYSASDNATVR